MIHVSLSPEAKGKLADHLYRKIEWAKRCYQNYHTSLIPKYRRIYEAQPLSPVKTQPWIGCANTVVPIAQILTDSMQAKFMSAVFQTDPLWVLKAVTELARGVEPMRGALEKFMGYVGISKDQMDLYRVYSEASRACISIGTDWIKAPWTKDVEKVIREEAMGASVEEFTRFEGPQVHRVPLENMFTPFRCDHEDNAEWIFQRLPNMNREALQERRYFRTYYRDAVDNILLSPDQQGPNAIQREKESAAGVITAPSNDFAAEWEIYECHMKCMVPNAQYGMQSRSLTGDNEEAVTDLGAVPGGYYRLIVTYHPKTRTILRAVYNFYPKNQHPYVAMRFILRDEGFPARGFAEVLEQVQIAATQVKNNRLDNGTIANTRIFKAKGSKARLAAQNMFPNAIWLVDNMDDIEAMQAGDVYPSAFSEGADNYDLAERMTGVGPPMQAQGSGAVGKTRGVYTALGTMSLLQTGNSRSDIRICDIRYAHMALGNKVASFYSHFGMPEGLKGKFGTLTPTIIEALKSQNLDQLAILVRASSASINREVERQNQQLMIGQVDAYFQKSMQMIGAMGNVNEPMPVRQYQEQALNASTLLMRVLLKVFDYDDNDIYVPTPPTLQAIIESMGSPPGAMAQQPGGNPQVPPQQGGAVPPGNSAGAPGGSGGPGPGPSTPSYGSPSAIPAI